MVSEKVTVKNKTGIHARPATFLVEKANGFKSNIFISNGTRQVSIKNSIIGILSMGIQGEAELEISAEGSDEAEAVKAIVQFIDEELGE